VIGASVTGDFTGDITELDVLGTPTDSGGQAVLTSVNDAHGRLKFMFCLTDVSFENREYALETNVTACNSN